MCWWGRPVVFVKIEASGNQIVECWRVLEGLGESPAQMSTYIPEQHQKISNSNVCGIILDQIQKF